MKKIFAIAMLALLLFNIGGYQLLFQYFIYQSDHSITEQINNDRYKSSDLELVKIPVHLNIDNWDDFKPISGAVKVKDKVYNYAELKMTRDTMYLMVIPNHDKARLQNANIVYSKEVNDAPLNRRGHDPVAKKIMSLSDYNLQFFRYNYTAFGTSNRQTSTLVSLKMDEPFIKSPGKPPNFVS